MNTEILDAILTAAHIKAFQNFVDRISAGQRADMVQVEYEKEVAAIGTAFKVALKLS